MNVTGTAADVDYGYIVTVEGHGELDPEVRVVRSRLYMQTTVNEANTLLETEMGIGLEQVTEFQKTLEALPEESK